VGTLVRRRIGHRRRIEDDDVGEAARFDPPGDASVQILPYGCWEPRSLSSFRIARRPRHNLSPRHVRLFLTESLHAALGDQFDI
jgi:hypothetical protein